VTGVLLAVDGGNSKTDVVLLSRDGTVLGVHRGPTVSHQQVGLEEAGRRLRGQVAALRASVASDNEIEAAVLCLAGLDFPEDERGLARAHGASGFGRVVLENDTIAGLRAGSLAGWGVGVVVGAGINAVGVAPGGRRARFAGLGPLSGDRGGGGGLGLEALGAAVRAGDRRGGRTSLERLVPEHFGMRRPIDVTLAMYHERLPQERVAELAAVAVRAAADGDQVALSLLDDLAGECAAFATAAIRRLGMTRLPVPVVLSGGVARGAGDLLAVPVTERVRVVAPAAAATVLHAPPVLGAALLALDMVAPGDAEAAERARDGIAAALF
jgi:N-acetylglucosamine kinase-like BadF-type ATPase